MDDLIRYLKKKAMRAILTPLRVCPVKKNRVLMINDISYNYSCNPKAITEYLLANEKNTFDIVYTVKDLMAHRFLEEKGVTITRSNSFKYFVYAMTSQVIVTNSGGISYIPLRKSQYVINTHHGGGAYKTAGIDMFEDSRYFRKDMMLSAKQTNCFLSTNKKFTECISKACLIPKDIFWEIGMPRNDRLINKARDNTEKTKEKIGIKQNQRLVLYAPTYRKPADNYYRGSIAIQYNIDSKMVCEALKKRFGGDWAFAYRLHPCVENKKDYIVDGALDLSGYEDMQDLLEVADVLINDFSSSFWDYMLTAKPCFMYAPDLDHYVETTKVYTPVESWPFPKSRTNEELKETILNFDDDKYRSDCKKHYDDLGGCESGQATRLVCNRIKEICGIKE